MPTSGCTGHSRARRSAHHAPAFRCSSAPSIKFRRIYNDERPHEALLGCTPTSLYQPSHRSYTGILPPIDYPGHFIVKRVTNAGTIRLKTRLLFIANALKQHPVGLEEVADGIWSIHFCHVLLGRVDERDYIIRA